VHSLVEQDDLLVTNQCPSTEGILAHQLFVKTLARNFCYMIKINYALGFQYFSYIIVNELNSTFFISHAHRETILIQTALKAFYISNI